MTIPNARLYFLLARTPLHMGCGDALGDIDKPTKRHVVTGHPQVPGSSLKGCIKDPAAQHWKLAGATLTEDQHLALFGAQGTDGIGMLSPQDGTLLLMPIASGAGGWAWATSPAVLHRLRRSALLTALGLQDAPPAVVPVVPADTTALIGKVPAGTPLSPLVLLANGVPSVILLEAMLDPVENDEVNAWARWLRRLAMAGEPGDWASEFERRIVIVHDEVFDWLCSVGTDVRARNQIGDDGMTEDHKLWREECVPEDSLFYGTLSAQPVPGRRGTLTEQQALQAPQACDLQLGGKGSVGYGWASFRPLPWPQPTAPGVA